MASVKAALPAVRENNSRRYDWRPLEVSADGFFWHTGTRLYFIDWDGRARKLGA